MSVKSKVITLNTPCVRTQRTLIWLQKQDQRDWKKWDAVVTSLEDYIKWYKYANIVGIVLDHTKTNTFYEDLFKISPHVPMIVLSNAILSTKSQEYWADNYDNIVQLDILEEDYPYLGHPWDGTTEDAVALFTHLCRYNRLVDCSVSPIRMDTFNGYLQLEKGIVPPTAWLITQYFRHPDASRAAEIMECLKKNVECADIKTIILLTEKDYSKDWQYLKTTKIQQFIIKKRLTYAHFLQFVKDRVPKNTIAMLSNADIFMDSILDLWRINLKNKMLALLRWDITDTSDLDSAEIFGPRADSQDTWIVLSDSVKEIDWAYEKFDVQLGQPGCDNLFAGQMLQNRFVLYNPAMTFKTYHLHATEIRNYTKADTVKAMLYVNLVPSYIIDTKQEKMTDPIHTMTNELVSFEVKSSSISNEITYCTMLEKEGRYKWEPSVENYYFDETPVYVWQNACVTPNGLVYTPYTIYPGDDEKYPYWKTSTVTIFTPLQQTDQMIAIPLEDMSVFEHPDTYILYYLSRILRLLKQYPKASFWVPKEYTSYVLDYNVQNMIYVSNDTACYAKEVIGYVPGPAEIGKEEIQLLREYLPYWKATPDNKRCVVIGAYNKEISDLFSNWSVQFEEEASFEALVGASLCIITQTSTVNATAKLLAAKLWALPKEAMVVEFQQELEVHGELQHIAHVAELKPWVILLSKGSPQQIQQQTVHELKRWTKKFLTL
jgi:hypothetical protein